MDKITIRNVRVAGRHGANPGERSSEQLFDVNVILEIDLDAASRSDALEDTLDYAAVHRRIVETVQVTSFELLERLAAEIATAIFVDPRVLRAEIAVAKPEILDGATASVTLVRENPRTT